MAKVTGYQVNVSFGTPPLVYMNLYDGNTQVGRIEVDEPRQIAQLALTVDMLAGGSHVEWNEAARVLHFGMETVGSG